MTLQRRKKKQPKFKPGDRVRYTREFIQQIQATDIKAITERRATVTGNDEFAPGKFRVLITWDDGSQTTFGAFEAYLRRA